MKGVGILEYWNIGKMEKWKKGKEKWKMEKWKRNDGKVE